MNEIKDRKNRRWWEPIWAKQYHGQRLGLRDGEKPPEIDAG
jgi:hypothetical protein